MGTTHAEKAAEHAGKAEELLAETQQSRWNKKLTREVQAALAAGHATLALYYQRPSGFSGLVEGMGTHPCS